ncbi:serine/threonine protein kinase [Richelia sinica FACHB-800]|uniref:non-specific serine/threonine protein kinase n=1 Tax=Richelia sinica FACHB-800 TaxID=1357546 RepID=A0A975T6D7_9NOST|nr:serine/threonine-protein kinase [Richelia sinica]MBD2664362.1 serine/threonine protein kinase [Richelia sinica FACHB-800]QXE22241.1 serine/threonine protein kinase [Richelia sinica FACHB-800]
MSNQMIGKVLQERYQIVQSLGAGVFGQTYVALDLDYADKPRYVVKQLKVNSYQMSSCYDYLRLRFLTETETLQILGSHDQIPQLITCFEENERFYLVQEFVAGQALANELALNQELGHRWSENDAVVFLEDVLSILDFVHSQGFIHCDVKPENLIRRAFDGRLVLIDFGSIQPVDFSTESELAIYQMPATSLGYIPPEQFLGQTQPSSDIYALGMIAIQGLTGLTPLQFNIDPVTNEIIWLSENSEISEYLAAFLTQMIRYNHQDRFQSAKEALQVLQQMIWVNQPEETPQLDEELLLEPITHKYHHSTNSSNSKSSPLLAGLRLGLTINSLLLGWGVYSLAQNSISHSETATLYTAIDKYQSGDVQQAITLAQSIPTHSNVYPEAQANIGEWKKQWQTSAEKYLVAEQALKEGRWLDVLRNAPKVPTSLYWQSKTGNLVQQAQVNIQFQTQSLLTKAYKSAENRDFSTALEYLRQIPPETSAGAIVQKKLAEYSQKKEIRASHFLNEAHKKAGVHDFNGAIKFLQKVPKDTTVYPQAQRKLQEYSHKQNIRQKNQKS